MPDERAVRMHREAIVREHMESENEQRFDDTIGTFSHPHYELIATGEIYDGEAAVREYYRASRERVPNQRNEIIAFHHTDDAVIVEFWLRGTSAAVGRAFECQMTAFFVFGGDLIVNERVYWDQKTVLDQLRP